MLLILVFIPLFNFCYMWFLDLILGKRTALLVIAHSYVLMFVLGVIGFFKVCVLGVVQYFTLGT
jgi:hypothetical protein